MVIANVAGRSLTEPAFEPIWAEIDRRALPVLVHPGEPPGADLMDMGSYDLSWSVGFMFDTTLAFTRMIFDGFLDRYPDLKLIAAHGGGTLPYLVGRFEKGDEVELPERRRMTADSDRLPPPDLVRLHHLRPGRPAYLISVVGADRVLFGTDWPHQVHAVRSRSPTRPRCRKTSAKRSAAATRCGCFDFESTRYHRPHTARRLGH